MINSKFPVICSGVGLYDPWGPFQIYVSAFTNIFCTLLKMHLAKFFAPPLTPEHRQLAVCIFTRSVLLIRPDIYRARCPRSILLLRNRPWGWLPRHCLSAIDLHRLSWCICFPTPMAKRLKETRSVASQISGPDKLHARDIGHWALKKERPTKGGALNQEARSSRAQCSL